MFIHKTVQFDVVFIHKDGAELPKGITGREWSRVIDNNTDVSLSSRFGFVAFALKKHIFGDV